MTGRKALLVGSMPFADEEDAMRRALNALSDCLFCLPDGEIGEKTELYPRGKRAAWVMTAINICAEDTENWQVVKDVVRDSAGFPVDYDKVQRLRPKRSPSQMHNHLYFGYHDYFKCSYPIFQRLRAECGREDLKFQVGVPTGLGITFSMMHPIHALRYADAFNRRVAYEVNEILKIAGDDVVIQLEVPGELAMAYKLPDFLVSLSLRSIFGLVRKIDPSTEIGVHLCLGDLNNKALIHPSTLHKMVNFSNHMVKNWPQTHKLTYIHFPLAEAAEPPPLVAGYYAPLRDIQLPPDTRFIAGFVHEKRTQQENEQILRIIEGIRGHSVDVACSCGLGRRSSQEAETLINMMAALAHRTA